MEQQQQHRNADTQHNEEIVPVCADQFQHILSHKHHDQQQRRQHGADDIQHSGTGYVHVADMKVGGKLVSAHILKNIARHIFHQIRLGIHRQCIFHAVSYTHLTLPTNSLV